MASKAFGEQKRPAGKEFRDGTVGEALDDIYRDVDAGFQALEQPAEADIPAPLSSATAEDLATKLNALLAKLRDAGIIADS